MPPVFTFSPIGKQSHFGRDGPAASETAWNRRRTGEGALLWETAKAETTSGNAHPAAKRPSASRSRRKAARRKRNSTREEASLASGPISNLRFGQRLFELQVFALRGAQKMGHPDRLTGFSREEGRVEGQVVNIAAGEIEPAEFCKVESFRGCRRRKKSAARFRSDVRRREWGTPR